MNILNKFNEIVHIHNNVMYSDDGLVMVPDNRRVNDKIRNLPFKDIKVFAIEMEVDMIKKVAEYMDVE